VPTTLLLATANRGKIREYVAILYPVLSSLDITLLSLEDLAREGRVFRQPVEGGLTFEANARVKAAYYSKLTGFPALADDSGLRVMALNGQPGTRSARFGGSDLTDQARCERLLAVMSGIADRRAYFEAAVVAVKGPEDEGLAYRGRLDGHIARRLIGQGGFGYDPLFIPEGSDLTLAQMSLGEKNRISHRFKAIEALNQDSDGLRAWPRR
jgi:XTP/dITP diphosphohydrolase